MAQSKFIRVLNGILTGIVVVLNVICAGAMVFSAYCHHLSPERWPASTIVSMTFPIWFAALALLFAIDLAWWRRTAMLAGVAMLVCGVSVSSFCPLNLPKLPMSKEEKARSFTLMSYNVWGFQDFAHPEGLVNNRQLDYILKHQPDIVCIEESDYMSPESYNHIQQWQLDSVHAVYPYVLVHGIDFALLSKFPAEMVELDFPAEEFASGNMACWRLDIYGNVVNIFSVHLRSLHLTPEDKALYKEVVKLDSISTGELRSFKAGVVPKINEAGVERARQVAMLQKYIKKYGGKNVIVCGDFNDVENSWAVRQLTEKSGLRQVYNEVAFGPDYTYHANYLYFRIDHILYRGSMRPYKLRRGHIGASDHYPLTATFIMD